MPTFAELAVQIARDIKANRGQKGERGPEGPYGGTAVTDPQVAQLLTEGPATAPILASKVGKGELSLSVADYPTPEAAVSAAMASGAPLYWPPGQWATNSAIPDLHKVRSSGPGMVARGSSIFHPSPGDTTTNTLYVNPAGSDSEDGLTPGRAFATFQAAFNALTNYGPVLRGFWVIEAATGVYPITDGQHTLATQSKNRVVVKGPAAGHPNEPTAIIDGTGGAAYRHGLSVSGLGAHAEFRDLKFVGFTAGAGDGTRIGVLAENESSVTFTNIHVTGASWCGAYAFNTVRARVNGGIFDGCRSGFIANDTQATVTNTIVRNSTESGIYWSRGSQGHIDYATLESNAIGLFVGESSRVDTVGNIFKRNRYGIRTSNGGVYGEGGAKNQYNIGTADAQIQSAVQHFIGSGDSSVRGSAYGWMRVGGTRSGLSHTGSATAKTLATPHTIAAGMLTQQTMIRVYGVITAATAGTTLWVKFGGNTITFVVPAVTATTPFELEATLSDVSGGHQSYGHLIVGALSSAVARGSGAVGSPNALPVQFGATLVDAADNVVVYRSDVSAL